jgi:hypothetical protein
MVRLAVASCIFTVFPCGSILGAADGGEEAFSRDKESPQASGNALDPLGARMYVQEFSLPCADEGAALRLELEPCPLLNDASWAFSGRWDDCNNRNIEMKRLMSRHGCRATFYLNSYTREPPFGINKYAFESGSLLAADGFSVGGHTLQHPALSKVDKNELFRQLAADRVYLEFTVGKPVNSFAFPGSDYGQRATPEVRADIAEALIRAGYLHTVTKGFVQEEQGNRSSLVQEANIVSPGDENPDAARFDNRIKSCTDSEKIKAECPNLTVGIHVRHTPEGMEKLGRCLERYSGNPNWWYCNQTEYAAYRCQYRASRLEKVKAAGGMAFFRLRRPYGADLGDDVPMSFRIRNAKIDEAALDMARLEIVRSGESTILNVRHDDTKTVPVVIGMCENKGNLPDLREIEPTRIPGLRFSIHVDEKAHVIKFSGRNGSDLSCEGISLLPRVPLGYAQNGQRIEFGTLSAAGTRSVDIPLVPLNDHSEYQVGNPYFIVQVDFIRGGKPARYYATAFVLNQPEVCAPRR